MTGINSPYEAPDSPELVVNTHASMVEQTVTQLATLLNP